MAKYRPKDRTFPPTWVRVRDENGHYDHRADLPLEDGLEVVPDYPEHIGELARPPKAKAELKADREALKDLAKSLDVPVGSKSDAQLAADIGEAQAAIAQGTPRTEAEASQQTADAESDTNTGSAAASEGSE